MSLQLLALPLELVKSAVILRKILAAKPLAVRAADAKVLTGAAAVCRSSVGIISWLKIPDTVDEN